MEADKISIRDFTIFNGRNIYSHRPVMKMIVDIGKYGDISTNKIPGFNEKLLEYFPGLKKNFCGLGYEGGFLERLNEGTYLAHVLEHVILEMQSMLGYDVKYGKTRTIEEPSLYYLICEFENETCGLECGKASVFILNCLLNGETVFIEEFLSYLDKVARDSELGPSTTAIVNEAKLRGIPVTRIGNGSLIRLGYGKHSRLIEATLTDATSCISADISCNKQLTKFLLGENQIPVPFGKMVYSELSALMAANQIGLPVVIKPFNGNQGKGVHLNLKNDEEIKAAYKEASKYSNGIIVEKYIRGHDYRILVVGNKVRAVSERLPASVTGDGVHSIRELVEMVNRDPQRGEKHEKPLTIIRIDETALNVLKKNKMTPEHVPHDGQTIVLRENANLSTGGTAIDCTDRIHPDNAEIAVRAANAIGIDIAGIDIVADNIGESVLETGGAVVEVNAAPGIRMHLFPGKGEPRNVAGDIVGFLFKDEESTSFPIVSVTGTNGKTTVARLINHTLTLSGKTVGLTCTSGTYVGGKLVCRGDNSGPRSARAILSNKTIDAAVLETARGGIVREGLGYDLADIGVITNISEDHLGIDGVNTLEDLVFVKTLVAEAVKKNGFAVLNADDKATPEVLKRVKSKAILFHKDAQTEKIYESPDFVHVYTANGWLRIRDGVSQTDVIRVDMIPITCGGRIECNIENALAATAALYGLGTGISDIAEGLKSFNDNSGRFSVYELNGVRVMLDYGHNPTGFVQVIKTLGKFEYNRLIGVIGMPGDRTDSLIKEGARICAGAFDSIILKEDFDLRGRKDGEVARLMRDSITESGYDISRLKTELDEAKALELALSEAEKGDLIVVFYEKLEPLQQYLISLGAKTGALQPNSYVFGSVKEGLVWQGR